MCPPYIPPARIVKPCVRGLTQARATSEALGASRAVRRSPHPRRSTSEAAPRRARFRRCRYAEAAGQGAGAAAARAGGGASRRAPPRRSRPGPRRRRPRRRRRRRPRRRRCPPPSAPPPEQELRARGGGGDVDGDEGGAGGVDQVLRAEHVQPRAARAGRALMPDERGEGDRRAAEARRRGALAGERAGELDGGGDVGVHRPDREQHGQHGGRGAARRAEAGLHELGERDAATASRRRARRSSRRRGRGRARRRCPARRRSRAGAGAAGRAARRRGARPPPSR